LKTKILIVGDAIVGSQTLDLVGQQVEVIKIDSSELSSKVANLNDVSALWIHFDTFLDKSFLKKISHIPYLISTTTGLTHIAKEIQDHYGTNLISLRNRTSLLSKITSTAEHAWLLIMHWNNNISESFNSVSKGEWTRKEYFRHQQLSGKTLGIIGFGRLGKMVANFGQAFKMNVLIYEIENEAINQAKKSNFKVVKSLGDLFTESDIVSMHASYNVGEKPIITKEILSLINKSMLLVNTARAGLVDEQSIIEEINQRPYLHYYTDVLSCEENGTNLRSSDLWKFSILSERVKITPHIGGANLEAAILCEGELLIEFLKRIELQEK
jgi:D-3-phosphoglycerate dehydrogenase